VFNGEHPWSGTMWKEFESLSPDKYMAYSSNGRTSGFRPANRSSTLLCVTIYGAVAQLEERLPCKQEVEGS
jgi:hypothetical protein